MDRIDERAVFARGPVVVFRWRNTDGWPVEYVSSNAEEVFGYSDEAFLNGDVVYASLVHPDDLDRVGQEVADGAASEAGSFVHEPYRVIHADGTERWLYDVTQVVRDAPGQEPSHFLGYVIDVTRRIVAEREQRALEAKMLQSQKLESMGLLAGGIAHDFNNLLTGILGETNLAQMKLDAGQAELAESLDRIETLTLRAAGLTRQLLAYSAKSEVAIEEVNLSELIAETVSMLGSIIPRRTRVEKVLPPVPHVWADRTQLQQVVMNLITNGSEALENQPGTVSLTLAENQRILGGVERQYVTISVADTGTGMKPEVQEHLFDPFFTTKDDGRGLGLSAVQGIVRGLKGEIDVKSTPGHGTVFEVHLPVIS